MKLADNGLRGRDVFVTGLLTPNQIGVLFGEVFAVQPSGIVLEGGAGDDLWLQSWQKSRRIEICELECHGDFSFKLSIDLDVPIAVDRFLDLAVDHRLTIAWAVDEKSPRDEYYVAFPNGSVVRHFLQFIETEDSYVCRLHPA